MGCSASTLPAPEQTEELPTSNTPTPLEQQTADLVVDFGRLMKVPAARHELIKFASREHSEENLLFYEKAQSFRTSHADSVDDDQLEAMRDEAIALINEFLAENATQQITLPYANPFKNGLPPTATPAANMFDPVCRMVHKSIEHDIFPRFKTSSYAKELLAKIPTIAKRLTGTSANRSTNSDTAGGTPLSKRGGAGAS